MSWIDLSSTRRLNQLVEKNKNNPERLIKVAKATKSIRRFLNETISLLYNTLDSIKDTLIFLGTFGMGLGLDVSTSILIGTLELATEAKHFAKYDRLLEKIRKIAEGNLDIESEKGISFEDWLNSQS